MAKAKTSKPSKKLVVPTAYEPKRYNLPFTGEEIFTLRAVLKRSGAWGKSWSAEIAKRAGFKAVQTA